MFKSNKKKKPEPTTGSWLSLIACRPWAFIGISFMMLVSRCAGMPDNLKHRSNICPPCDGFDVIAGALENATVIFVGDLHDENRGIACINSITESTTAKNQRILLERIPSGEQVNCTEFGFDNKLGRTCQGWDDPEDTEKAINDDLPNSYYQYLAKEFQKDYKNEKQFGAYLKNYIEKMGLRPAIRQPQNSVEKYTKKYQNYIRIQTAWQFIEDLTQHKQSGTYKSFLDNHIPPVYGDFEAVQRSLKLFSERILKRNKALMHTVQSCNANPKNQYSLTFVHGGRGHFFDDSGDLIGGEARKYIQDELEKHKAEYPYVILMQR